VIVVVNGDTAFLLLLQSHCGRSHFKSVFNHETFQITTNITDTKVVIRLSVNRLPVKLPITSFNFQLPITDLPTLFFTSCNFRLQLRLHWTQTYRRRPTARSRWFMLTQRLTVESAPLPSPRRVAADGKGGEGKRCELDGRRGLQRLEFCSPLIVAACMAASLTSTAT